MSVSKGLQKFFPKNSSLEIVAEPGRHFVDSAFTLATTIHTKKVTSRNQMKYFMYYINDGVYGSFSQLLTKRVKVQPKIYGKAEKPFCRCTIWGPTCDSLDKVWLIEILDCVLIEFFLFQILEDTVLPELDVGDWIFFENVGALTRVLATPFNSFPAAKTIAYISHENFDKILR
jgi:ornithine decarboxylase